jgi:hypothetical protein
MKMRFPIWLVPLLCVLLTVRVSAHLGMPFVVLEGRAGKFPVRVVVQEPDVVPGLAQIGVRILEGEAKGVTVLPLHWDTDRKGAPRPDPARPVSGEPGLYEGELWFMGAGAYGVVVEVEGEGGGTLVVPANSLATARTEMPGWMEVLLAILGTLLIVGWVCIGYVTFRESTVAGEPRGRWWRGFLGAGLAAAVAVAAVWGGRRWWNVEDQGHDAKVRAQQVPLTVKADRTGLEFGIEEPSWRGRSGAWDLVPDHGRLMHAFVVGQGPVPLFLHLHPESSPEGIRRSEVGDLPAGEYQVFVDVTHAMGSTQTLTNRLVVSQPIVGGGFKDPDDSRHEGRFSGVGESHPIGDGRVVRLDLDGRLRPREAVRLVARFRESDDRPTLLQPYLRMPGHAVVASEDGTVFTHLHPAGNLSMAAARRFALRAGGDAAAKNADEVCGDLGALPADVVGRLLASGEVTFPMVFPKAGPYWVWIQARIAGQVRTAFFRLDVPEG